ncbi:DsbA family protein [Arthrobacter cheniae]|uniref:DsbA family protein n=1 Tax=Arthrobacter cheniae TaxID=1258888 RepID=UPI001F39A2B6|nr:thioredoxin domain-containing protein [Arthrobacter cheniae]
MLATLAVATLVLFIGFFITEDQAPQGQEGSAVSGVRESVGPSKVDLDTSRRIDGDATALGAVDAPVVLVEYADYRCPFCGLFSRDTLPPLVDKYVDEGQVRIEWRDLPVFGEESFQAAVAGRAAGEQGKFWEFNKAVFADAPERGHIALPPEELVRIAENVGVPDIKRFTADLNSEELQQAVTADAEEAAALGATGTPAFLINDVPLTGAQPLEVFEEIIDAALAEAEAEAQ